MDLENLKSNEDEDIEKICIAFGMSKAELKLKLKCLDEYNAWGSNYVLTVSWRSVKSNEE